MKHDYGVPVVRAGNGTCQPVQAVVIDDDQRGLLPVLYGPECGQGCGLNEDPEEVLVYEAHLFSSPYSASYWAMRSFT